MASSALNTALRRLLVGLLLGFFVLACIRFALIQDIWIDESTQLSGVRLPIGDLVGWLGGADPSRFGVPGDRMPPLAYLLDHAWWQASGDAVTRFRMFHILLATGGVALLARTEMKVLGPNWLGIGAAFLVLSPKLIEAAAELRSYPLFFAVTCALVGLFLDILRSSPGWGRLVRFAGGCVVLSYIHFFGVVAAFAFFATLVLAFCTDRSALPRVLVVGAGLGLCLLGLYPFIFGATAISSTGSAASSGDILRYLPLLFGHPALLIYPVAAMLYFAGSGVLLLAAAIGGARRALERRTEPADWLFVVAMIGCVATILPGLLISSFSALKPSYSIWLLPVFALVIAQGASKPIGFTGWDRYGRVAAGSALLIGAGVATGIFLVKAPWFVHGPHRYIETAREQSPPSTAIVYAQPATFGYGYFPMVYQSGGRLPQWLVQGGGVARVSMAGTSSPVPIMALSSYQGLIVVDIRARHYTDLRACLQHHCPEFPPPPLVAALVGSGRWSVAAHRRDFGFYDADITRLTPKATLPWKGRSAS